MPSTQERPHLAVHHIDRKPPLLDIGSPLPSPFYTLASASDARAYLGGAANLQRHAQAQAAQQQVVVSPQRHRGSPAVTMLGAMHLATSSAHLEELGGLATSPHLSELHDGEPAQHFGIETARARADGAAAYSAANASSSSAASAAVTLARARGVIDTGGPNAVAAHLRLMLPALPPSPLNSLRVSQLPSMLSVTSIASGSLSATLAGTRESFELSATSAPRAVGTTTSVGAAPALSGGSRAGAQIVEQLPVVVQAPAPAATGSLAPDTNALEVVVTEREPLAPAIAP